MTIGGQRSDRLFPFAVAGSAMWLVCFSHVSSQSGVDFYWFLALLAGAKLLLVLWLLSYFRSPRGWAGSSRKRTLALSVFAAGVGLAALSAIPQRPLFRLRFELSRHALERAARRALQVGEGAKPGIAGLFPIVASEIHAGQVRFITTRCGLIDRCGVAFTGSSRPERRGEDLFEPLEGGWYHLTERF